jgi:hypothetical protein
METSPTLIQISIRGTGDVSPWCEKGFVLYVILRKRCNGLVHRRSERAAQRHGMLELWMCEEVRVGYGVDSDIMAGFELQMSYLVPECKGRC